jgi:hypothetical protein
MYLTRTLCFLTCTFSQVSPLSELCSLNVIVHFNWEIALFPLSVNMTFMHFPSFCTLRLNGARLFPAAFYFGIFRLLFLYALFSYLVIDISEEFAFRAFQRGIICHISVSLKSLAIVFKCVHKHKFRYLCSWRGWNRAGKLLLSLREARSLEPPVLVA